MADMVEIVKKIAQGVQNESSPCNVLFGTVINANPLEIQVEQKLRLTKEFLILTKNVRDYDVEVSLNWNTNNKDLSVQTENGTSDITHNHSISGKKTIKIHNALKKNDRVILIQQLGGQKYIVLDKAV